MKFVTPEICAAVALLAVHTLYKCILGVHMVQNSASRNKLRDACSHVFQGSTLDLELARFMLSAQHE